MFELPFLLSKYLLQLITYCRQYRGQRNLPGKQNKMSSGSAHFAYWTRARVRQAPVQESAA